MSSFQDLVNASYRVKESAGEFEQRTVVAAGQLHQQMSRLAALAQGNRTAEGAVAEVARAIREVNNTATQLRTLQREISEFITYVSE